MRITLADQFHLAQIVDRRDAFVIGIKPCESGHILHRAILPVGQNLKLHRITHLFTNKLLGEYLQPVESAGFYHIQLRAVLNPLEHHIVLPAAFVVDLPSLVLYLLKRFLDEQTLCGILEIHANAVFRVISNSLMVFAEIVAKQAQLKIAASLKRAVALAPAAAQLTRQWDYVPTKARALRLLCFPAKPLLRSRQFLLRLQRAVERHGCGH